jgi:hypothetical protein
MASKDSRFKEGPGQRWAEGWGGWLSRAKHVSFLAKVHSIQYKFSPRFSHPPSALSSPGIYTHGGRISPHPPLPKSGPGGGGPPKPGGGPWSRNSKNNKNFACGTKNP